MVTQNDYLRGREALLAIRPLAIEGDEHAVTLVEALMRGLEAREGPRGIAILLWATERAEELRRHADDT